MYEEEEPKATHKAPSDGDSLNMNVLDLNLLADGVVLRTRCALR